MDKAMLVGKNKLIRAQTEREILTMLDHPFLPTLYSHFETNELSCLVMEFCSGGDLHVLCQRQPGNHFSEQAARFYASEVLLSIEYLHMMGVIYRDLKPENVLVREDGHIMLSDFDLSLRCGVCPRLEKSTNQTSCFQPSCFNSQKTPKRAMLVVEPTAVRSMSFVGTYEYLAPEMIRDDGHGSVVDWWTFGVFLYELLHGKTPFKGNGNRETMSNIVGQSLKFPKGSNISFAAKDLIRGLLVKDPQKRLGYKRGAAEIKQHPFFKSINWALIRGTHPPEIPEHVDLSCLNQSQTLSQQAPDSDTSLIPYLDSDSDRSSIPHIDFDSF